MKNKIFILALVAASVFTGCGSHEDTTGRTAGDAAVANMENQGADLSVADMDSQEAEADAPADNVDSQGAETDAPAGNVDSLSQESGSAGGDSESDSPQKPEQGVREVGQTGSAGTITVSLPTGWECEPCPEGSEMLAGQYGMHIYPKGVSEGYVEIAQADFFGVCGTGLKEEEKTISDCQAFVGTYDGHDYWDFITFRGKNDGIVVLTYMVEDWWAEYGDQVMEIADTIKIQSGAADDTDGAISEDSILAELGLSLEVKEYDASGATLEFRQSGGNPTGELDTGDYFIIERLENGEWKEAPLIVDNAAFNDVAYIISNDDMTEQKVDWHWLYGELPSGEYRIGKKIMDFRGTGDYDEYMIYAHFIIN